MRTCIYLKTHACISKKREPQTKKTAGVLNVQSKHDRKTIEHGEGPGLGRRAVLQGSTVLLVFEASRGNASEFSNQGGMETLEDEDYNYLENEPAENMVATEAFSSLSAASVFLNTIGEGVDGHGIRILCKNDMHRLEKNISFFVESCIRGLLSFRVQLSRHFRPSRSSRFTSANAI